MLVARLPARGGAPRRAAPPEHRPAHQGRMPAAAVHRDRALRLLITRVDTSRKGRPPALHPPRAGHSAVEDVHAHRARHELFAHARSLPVLHRNLKSQNLLVDDGGKVKIADFGWSRLKTFDAGKTFFHGWQWVRARDPAWGGKYTEAADVYSTAWSRGRCSRSRCPSTGSTRCRLASRCASRSCARRSRGRADGVWRSA